MGFKIFCAETESKGKTFYRGYAGKGFGQVFVFEGEREKDGTKLMVVSIPRGMSLLKAAAFSRKRYTRKSYGGYRKRSSNNNYNRY